MAAAWRRCLALWEVRVAGDRLHSKLTKATDAATLAFSGVMAACLKRPRIRTIKRRRSAAIQAGYKEAVQSPLRIARNCLEAERLAAAIVKQASANAPSGVGVTQTYAGLLGAVMNVNIDLPSIKDKIFAERIA